MEGVEVLREVVRAGEEGEAVMALEWGSIVRGRRVNVSSIVGDAGWMKG